MQPVLKLAVQNIRKHERFSLNLSPGVTVVTGSNGSGKTSLLEALYVAFRGSSFKGSDKDMLRQDSDWWRVDVDYSDSVRRTVKFNPSLTSGKKQFTVNSKTSYRLAPKDRYPVVLFEPDNLRLVHGSPAQRRLFIDRLISQIDPKYDSALKKYERALRQRNTLLKRQPVAGDDLFAWNVSLSEYGSYLIEGRVNFIETINQQLNDEYRLISSSPDTVTVHYSHTLIGNTKDKLLAELHAALGRDQALGYTSVGPHRHDVLFTFNNQPALSVASRGEVRTVVLALKFIEIDVIRRLTGLDPVVLLDDVFSELDPSRQTYLLDIPTGQIIITSAHTPEGIKDYYSVEL